MARSWVLANVLWLAACGRLGFDERAAPPPDGDTATDATPIGPRAQLSATSLAASAECGVAQPPSVVLSIGNTGDTDLVVTSATATGGFTVTSPLPVTVPPGDATQLAIAPPPAIVGTDLAGDTKLGTLTLTTNDPVAAPPVDLTATVIGANIGFVAQGAPVSLVTFSAMSACPLPQPVRIVNTGTKPATIAFTGTSNVTFAGFSGGVLDASSSAAIDLRASTTGACAVNGGYLLYTVTGSVCTTTPNALAVKIDINGSSSCFCS